MLTDDLRGGLDEDALGRGLGDDEVDPLGEGCLPGRLERGVALQQGSALGAVRGRPVDLR